MWILVRAGALAFGLSSLQALASAQTYYRDSPWASDADRIRTQMMNDAANRGSGVSFAPVNNPFTDMIAAREANERANIEEAMRYADRISEEYRQRELAEQQRAADLEQSRQWEWARLAREEAQEAAESARLYAKREEQVAALRPYERARDPLKKLEGVWRSQLGYYPLVHNHLETQYEFQVGGLLMAAGEGEALGFVGAASRLCDDTPSMGRVLVEVMEREGAIHRTNYLLSLHKSGHVGATLWLAGWILGRPVGLGDAPVAIPGASEPRAFALAALRGLAKKQPLAALPWLVHELSVDFARSGAREPEGEFQQVLRDLASACMYDGPLRPLGQCALGLALIHLPGRSDDGVHLLRQSTGLLEQNDSSREPPLPIAAAALGRMLIEGRSTGFSPRDAAEAFAQLPSTPRWDYDRALGSLARAYENEFDPRATAPSPFTLSLYREAVKRFARARKRADTASETVIPPDATADERDAQLWLLAAQARFEKDDEKRAAARIRLGELCDEGDPWALVMRAYVGVHQEPFDAAVFVKARGYLRAVPLFGRPFTGARALTVLRCISKYNERDGRDSLAYSCQRVAEMNPIHALSRGLGELACSYFSDLQPRDAEDRADGPWLFEQFVRAGSAGSTTGMWCRAAALAEVLQVQPISSAEWDQRWLREFEAFTKDEQRNQPEYREIVESWRDLMREPTPEKIDAMEARELSIRHAEYQDGFHPLLASLRLRTARDNDSAEGAAQVLFRLALKLQWHAQALVIDFDERYKASYVARGDTVGFHRDAARAAEHVASWREVGSMFAPEHPARRIEAMTRAILHGGTRYKRTDLADLRPTAPDAVAAAMAVLDRMQTSGMTTQQLDEFDALDRLVRQECLANGRHPAEFPTRTRLRLLATAIGNAQGGDAALRYIESQRAALPYVDWELGELYDAGEVWLPGGCSGSIEAFERAAQAAQAAQAEPTPAQVLLWADCVGRAGTEEQLERVTPFVLRPDVRVLFDATDSAPSFGEELADLADRWQHFAAEAVSEDFEQLALAHALELRISGVEFGSGQALEALRKIDLQEPHKLERIGNALLDCSTLNVPLALPWFLHAQALSGAPSEALAPWGDPVEPTWRARRLTEWRAVLVDPTEVVYEKHERARCIERRELLKVARLLHSDEAIEILRDVYGVPLSVVDEKPKTWAMVLYLAAHHDDLPKVLTKLPDLEAMMAEAEAVHGADSEERAEFNKAIELVALCLQRHDTPPEGLDSHLYERVRSTVIQLALDEGALNVYVALVDHAKGQQDEAMLVSLAQRILEIDVCNAVLLEESLRPALSDTQSFDALFVEYGLYQPGTTEPTAIYDFISEHRAFAIVHRTATTEPYRLPKLFSKNPRWRKGWLGELLALHRTSDDEVTLNAFAELGIAPQDADELARR